MYLPHHKVHHKVDPHPRINLIHPRINLIKGSTCREPCRDVQKVQKGIYEIL